jgi:hypothetical protein
VSDIKSIKFDISAESGYRKTFTDYLDDAHGAYADPALFADNPPAGTWRTELTNQFAVRKGVDRTDGVEKIY